MTCSIEGCERTVQCKGMCEPHYRRTRRFGHPCVDVAIGDLQKKAPTICRCIICDAEFTKVKGTTGKHCSRRCAWMARGGPAFSAEMARSTAAKRGDTLRGRGEGKAYRKRGGRHEHRVVAEEMLGRALRPGEVVHHIDGDKLNNDPSNLAVMTQAEHMRVHGLGIPGQRPAWQTRSAA